LGQHKIEEAEQTSKAERINMQKGVYSQRIQRTEKMKNLSLWKSSNIRPTVLMALT
jgi:hypothetical protein